MSDYYPPLTEKSESDSGLHRQVRLYQDYIESEKEYNDNT